MDLGTFRALLTDEGQAVLAAVHDRAPPAWPATLTPLRRDHSAEPVTAAIQQQELRAYRPWGEAVFIDVMQRAAPDGNTVVPPWPLNSPRTSPPRARTRARRRCF
ncbi:hypothetical protein [Streptomyces sp. NPDC090021]|uniref:hypothetical protein n=1 Tax=Streptomyces sp. NPDC090021 TaxID=3365919 RepID=UPI0037FF2614